jgi:hypothetical protein
MLSYIIFLHAINCRLSNSPLKMKVAGGSKIPDFLTMMRNIAQKDLIEISLPFSQ